MIDKWSSKDRIANYVRANEANGAPYRITIIHAEDDNYIPWSHSRELFWHAVNATKSTSVNHQELDHAKMQRRSDLGPAGSVMTWATETGTIREEILKTGRHNVIQGNQVVSLAVMRILETLE